MLGIDDRELGNAMITTLELCLHCIDQLAKKRTAPPHPRLKLLETGPEAGHGRETRYQCMVCDEIIVHSTDRSDPAWR